MKRKPLVGLFSLANVMLVIGCSPSKWAQVSETWAFDYVEYGKKVESFHSARRPGLCVTLIDSTDSVPIPGAQISMGMEGIVHRTDGKGNCYFGVVTSDTLYVGMIGFQFRKVCYRSNSRDSIVISLAPRVIILDQGFDN